MAHPFLSYRPDDVRLLLEEYPLAAVQACADVERGFVSQLPLVGEYDAQGRLVALIGHMGRRNPLHALLEEAPRASILFRGPQGYVSPGHAGVRDWAPTWNYVQLHVAAELRFADDLTRPALDLLIEAMEAGRAAPWSRAEMGPREAVLAEAIIGFRAEVISCAGVFKLGQDESPEVRAHIVETHPDPALVAWMRRFER